MAVLYVATGLVLVVLAVIVRLVLAEGARTRRQQVWAAHFLAPREESAGQQPAGSRALTGHDQPGT